MSEMPPPRDWAVPVRPWQFRTKRGESPFFALPGDVSLGGKVEIDGKVYECIQERKGKV